jgi:hypothetical protein
MRRVRRWRSSSPARRPRGALTRARTVRSGLDRAGQRLHHSRPCSPSRRIACRSRRAMHGHRCAPAVSLRRRHDPRTSRVQIDHIVLLANAWRSGACRWTREQRVRFPTISACPELIAVSASTNTSKGDRAHRTGNPRAGRCGAATRGGGSTSRPPGASPSPIAKRALCRPCPGAASRIRRPSAAEAVATTLSELRWPLATGANLGCR